MTESRLRQIIREEIADVEPYDDVRAKVHGQSPTSSEEHSVEVRVGEDGLPILYVFAKGRPISKTKLGRREAQEIAKALT